MSSVRVIAREAGVSITTVSRALNDDPSVSPQTRERVLRVANRCGYGPTIGRRVTTNVGVAYTQDVTIGHPFDASVLEGVTRGSNEQRFDVVVLHLQRDKRRGETYTQFFRRKGVPGVILRTNMETRHVCTKIAEEGFPHVVISERFDLPLVNWIDCESRTDSFRAVDYLITLGHRRIAFGMSGATDRDHMDRFEGYRQALAARGLPFCEDLVFKNQFTMAGGATVMNMAVGLREPPTAIYFADPMMAVGAVQMAHALGIHIPGDLSIVGFDDTDVRYSVYPTLTAVCQDATQLGFQAAMWLTNMVTGASKEPFQKTIPTFFEINHSAGPAPAVSPGGAATEGRAGEVVLQPAGPAATAVAHPAPGVAT
jgi:DNA-binding LacI/PurR family transcriptional regulator